MEQIGNEIFSLVQISSMVMLEDCLHQGEDEGQGRDSIRKPMAMMHAWWRRIVCR
jgi:hypothetical protein